MVMYHGQRRRGEPYSWESPASPDEVATQLAQNLFDDFNRGYVALGQFRGKIDTEMRLIGQSRLLGEFPGPDPLKIERTLEEVDRAVSSAQDDLDRALEQLRLISPGTLLVTIGRKPHHLPGR